MAEKANLINANKLPSAMAEKRIKTDERDH
jgi:hypothetical protein